MTAEALTRELARHGMKPGPRGYMVGAMLQVLTYYENRSFEP
jgi:hypothetical protein